MNMLLHVVVNNNDNYIEEEGIFSINLGFSIVPSNSSIIFDTKRLSKHGTI